ncbi:sodium/proline symporter PutP [Spinactinospora alkalitolerans]|nr:sodium/proline symporter PutP [Spinactinospora alkalitolerans]
MIGSVVTFAVYFVVMVAVGLLVYKRTTSLSDFVLGGRQLNSWVAGLSANASDFSGWLLLGLPGAIYLSGLGEAWIAVGLGIGFYASWRIVAPRLRVYTERVSDLRNGGESNSLTLSSYLENRFGDHSGLLRGISAILILVFYLFYVASGLLSMGVLFDQVFGWPPAIAVIVGASIIVLYTFLGGFLAVSLTDVIQAAMMWIALLIVPVVAVVTIGGFGTALDTVGDRNENLLSAFGGASLADGSWQTTDALGAVVIVSGLAWGIGYLGQPHILARFMGIRSIADIPKARVVSVGWAVTAMFLAVLVGFSGIAYFDTPIDNPESVFLSLIQALTHPLVAGLLLAAVLAAVMSTADSQLLVAAAALTEDGYRAFMDREAPARRLVLVSRLAVIGVAVAAGLLALYSDENVLGLVGYAWAGFGAGFGPVIVLSLYWKKMNWIGALGGMIGGGATAIIWDILDERVLGTGLYAMVPAVVVSLAAIFILNPLGRATERMGDDFDVMEREVGAGV